jgi:hypothetical protein
MRTDFLKLSSINHYTCDCRTETPSLVSLTVTAGLPGDKSAVLLATDKTHSESCTVG